MTAYKRPDLLFTDLERLRKINARHPFQLVMAGKAHPSDGPGKALIRRIHDHIAELGPELRIAFLPNYDMAIAKVLVPGADVWLNTPEPPLEASGTSGMKAALNGVLNLSVLDGWWIEGCFENVTGWAIDHSDANSLYEKLEQIVVPRFCHHRENFIQTMRQSIALNASHFN